MATPERCRTYDSPYHPRYRTAVLALNNEHAEELSWLEPAELSHLVSQAFYARRIGNLEAFLLAFDQTADYDIPTSSGSRRATPVSSTSTVSPSVFGARTWPRSPTVQRPIRRSGAKRT